MQATIIRDGKFGTTGTKVTLADNQVANTENFDLLLARVAQGNMPMTEQLAKVVAGVVKSEIERTGKFDATIFLQYPNAEIPAEYWPVEQESKDGSRATGKQDLSGMRIAAPLTVYVNTAGRVVPGAGEIVWKDESGSTLESYVPAVLSEFILKACAAKQKKDKEALAAIGLAIANLVDLDFTAVPNYQERGYTAKGKHDLDKEVEFKRRVGQVRNVKQAQKKAGVQVNTRQFRLK